MEHTLYYTLRQKLIALGVPVYQNSPAAEIRENGAYFTYNGNLAFVEVDTVVLAVGSLADNALAEELKKTAPELTVYEIGDCKQPRNALAATNDAADLAYTL